MKQNCSDACHTRFVVFFPLPFCCVSSLFFWQRSCEKIGSKSNAPPPRKYTARTRAIPRTSQFRRQRRTLSKRSLLFTFDVNLLVVHSTGTIFVLTNQSLHNRRIYSTKKLTSRLKVKTDKQTATN